MAPTRSSDISYAQVGPTSDSQDAWLFFGWNLGINGKTTSSSAMVHDGSKSVKGINGVKASNSTLGSK